MNQSRNLAYAILVFSLIIVSGYIFLNFLISGNALTTATSLRDERFEVDQQEVFDALKNNARKTEIFGLIYDADRASEEKLSHDKSDTYVIVYPASGSQVTVDEYNSFTFSKNVKLNVTSVYSGEVYGISKGKPLIFSMNYTYLDWKENTHILEHGKDLLKASKPNLAVPFIGLYRRMAYIPFGNTNFALEGECFLYLAKCYRLLGEMELFRTNLYTANRYIPPEKVQLRKMVREEEQFLETPFAD